MRKMISMVLLSMAVATGFAQGVDKFNVGHFEVEYKGMGDYKITPRPNIDLYEFYGLKRDTVVNIIRSDVSTYPLEHAIQLNAYYEGNMHSAARFSNAFGIDGSWKQKIGEKLYLNGGISLGLATATCRYNGVSDIKEGMLEIGIPISLELANLCENKSTLYGSIGLTPAFYSNSTAKYDPEIRGNELEKHNGLYLAPRIDFGGYIPVADNFVRVGVFFRYKINCSTKDYDVYKNIIGTSFVGANVGLVF